MTNSISFNPFPKTETNRLILRKLRLKDSKSIFDIRTEVESRKYVDVDVPKTVEDARKFIKKINGGVSRDAWIYWAITLKELNELIGTICLWNFSEDQFTAELGYELNAKFRGKGYMTESVKRVLDFGFETLNLKKIEAYVHSENRASIKILERFGFEFERVFEETHSTGFKYEMAVYSCHVIKK